MNSVVIRPTVLYFGTPVVLVSTKNPDGSTNVAPMSSAWALDDRVVLGLGNAGQTLANVLRERECVLNVASPEIWPAVERLASTTGREDVPAHKRAAGFSYVKDKLARAGLTAAPSDVVAPPRVAECPLQLEAQLIASFARGGADPDEGYTIAETRVLRVHAHESAVVAGTSRVDVTRYAPLLYVFRHYFGARGPLGKTFRA
jgi:flavin reductase (DIM6/NTAB) family NADH-FMN oxidoreductase RutF